jgi:hypothetical protein
MFVVHGIGVRKDGLWVRDCAQVGVEIEILLERSSDKTPFNLLGLSPVNVQDFQGEASLMVR